ncbi:MAG: hypothetical protein J7J87_00675 [Candidatus Diapherotrites archaeon]|nr:hypothetical protein [Candidatus Diapherotrites archaeon]
MGSLEGLIRTCKYSFAPNSLGYCGAKDFSVLFERFIKEPSEQLASRVEEALHSFVGLHSYLLLIAEHNSLSEFDESVIEAYWLGNSLLKNVPVKAVRELIEKKFVTLPLRIRQQKACFLKQHAYVQHSFHVLFIQFLTPKVAPLVSNLDKCIIKWADVLEVKEDKLKVKSIALIHENNELKLKEKLFNVENRFIEEPKEGMLISVHWDNAVEEIGKEQQKNLKKCLLANIELANAYTTSVQKKQK